MNDLFAVFRREVAERRLALLLAAVVGVCVLALPLLPGLERHPAAEVWGVGALVLGVLTGLAGAVTLGSSVWAGDLTSGRLGFYLVRPIRSWALWAGKLTALVVLLAGMIALASAPGLWAGDGLRAAAAAMLPSWAVNLDGPRIAGALLTLALLAHHARMLAARRTAWLLVDLAALVIAAALAALAGRDLLDAPAIGDFWRGTGVMLLLVATTAAAAIAIELAVGRMDGARGRLAVSLVLASGFVASGLLALVFARWTLSAGPMEFESMRVLATSPNGRWLHVAGPVPHRAGYAQSVLYDLERRSAQTLGGTPFPDGGMAEVQFSTDGGAAIWTHFSTFSWQVLRIATEDTSHRTPVDSGPQSARAFSPSGQRLASYNGERLIVLDVSSDSERLLASERLPLARWFEVRFLDEQRVRVLGRDLRDGQTPEVWDLDVSSGRLESVCRLPDQWPLALSLAGDRLAARSNSTADTTGRRSIYALPSCEPRSDLAPSRLDWQGNFRFLADGRIVEVLLEDQGRILRLYDRDGFKQRDFDLGPTARLPWLGGMPSPHELVVAAGASGGPHTAYVLDLDSGAKRELGSGLLPVATPATAVGSLATRTFTSTDGLVQLDLATGERVLLTTVPALQD